MSQPRKFTARYSGRCPSCHEPIDIGDTLVMDDDVAVHLDCAGRAGVPDLAGRRREVCPRCFTERSVSGACACEEPS